MRDSDARPRTNAEIKANFAEHLGARIVSATAERVEMEMPVTPILANNNNVLHGGALMGLADHAGGTGALLNIPHDRATTTIESKTNFFRPVRIGDVARATSVPLHRGTTTQVWQTSISRGDGKLVAIITQTQMVFEWKA